MTSVAAGEHPDSTLPITSEPRYSNAAEVFFQPITMTQVDPNRHFNCDGTIAFIQRLMKTHAEDAPNRGVDFLVAQAANHWGMNPNFRPEVSNAPIHIVLAIRHTLPFCARS
jgi:hypothetical protein